MAEVQHAPFSIQVELVEGCNLACSFCGINGIRKKPGDFKFMGIALAARIAREVARVGWDARIEFAMHGEPSLHPMVVEIVALFREKLPRASLMMTSNGTGLTPLKARKLQEAGLNTLGLDQYDHCDAVDRLLKSLPNEVLWYPDDPAASLYKKRKGFTVIGLRDIRYLSTGNHVLANHAGCAAPLDYGRKNHRCAFPFRELSIRWDGNVALCCDDFRGVYKVGNVKDLPIDALWQHERFRAARRKLYHRQRDFAPCLGCNAMSFRVGLLPDPTGQDALPLPTAHDRAILREAVKGKPFTKPVLRKWESKDASNA